MSKLVVTGSIAKISASRAIGWLQQPFFDFKVHRKAMLLNFLLVGAWTAMQQMLQSYPWLYLILLFVSFSVVGTVIMNVHASVKDGGSGVTRMGGFKTPLLQKMLVENSKMVLAGVAVVAAVFAFLYFGTDMFEEKSAVVLGKLYSSIQEAQAILAQNGGDPKLLEELFKSIGASFTLDEATLLRSLVLRIMGALAAIMILWCLVFSYFWAVPMFLAIADEAVDGSKPKMHNLSFWGLISLRNFLAWLTFGLGMFVISMFVSTVGQVILQAVGSNLMMPVNIVTMSLLYTYFLWCVYYIFCDLYCVQDGKSAGHAPESRTNTPSLDA